MYAKVHGNRQLSVYACLLFWNSFDLSSSVILWEEIAIEACWALARLPPSGYSRLAMTRPDQATRLWLATRCCIRPRLKITRLAFSTKAPRTDWCMFGQTLQ